MEFPVSRQELLMYKTDVILKKAIDERVAAVVAAICSGVATVVATSDKHRFVYDATALVVFQLTRVGQDVPRQQQLVLNRIMDELKMRFVDCAIILDPLMKTLTVSWEKQGPGDWHG
jgi:hypothetical protein